uniref:Uncharacterized protein n=1 Tax=Myoviridae sp. ctshb19 TaxID=2825194 RepID=A0A8S5UH17_9CAUD|nr:MAG TPA: hypothetical protein [Myoviridae sp. ctshb19]
MVDSTERPFCGKLVLSIACTPKRPRRAMHELKGFHPNAVKLFADAQQFANQCHRRLFPWAFFEPLVNHLIERLTDDRVYFAGRWHMHGFGCGFGAVLDNALQLVRHCIVIGGQFNGERAAANVLGTHGAGGGGELNGYGSHRRGLSGWVSETGRKGIKGLQTCQPVTRLGKLRAKENPVATGANGVQVLANAHRAFGQQLHVAFSAAHIFFCVDEHVQRHVVMLGDAKFVAEENMPRPINIRSKQAHALGNRGFRTKRHGLLFQ